MIRHEFHTPLAGLGRLLGDVFNDDTPETAAFLEELSAQLSPSARLARRRWLSQQPPNPPALSGRAISARTYRERARRHARG